MIRSALLVVLLLSGSCSDASPPFCGGVELAPRVELVTPRGIKVWCPTWVPDAWRPALLDEIDTTPAQNGTKVLPNTWSVWIGSPGKLETPHSPSGLATGWTCYRERQIVAAWKPVAGQQVTPYLPALAHEVGHVHGGPRANHNGNGCSGCQGESP